MFCLAQVKKQQHIDILKDITKLFKLYSIKPVLNFEELKEVLVMEENFNGSVETTLKELKKEKEKECRFHHFVLGTKEQALKILKGKIPLEVWYLLDKKMQISYNYETWGKVVQYAEGSKVVQELFSIWLRTRKEEYMKDVISMSEAWVKHLKGTKLDLNFKKLSKEVEEEILTNNDWMLET